MADRAKAFAPGRVNLIGEHTDYNQGLALPMAISQGVTVTADAVGERTIRARAVDLGDEDTFELEWPIRVEGWRSFVRGAVAELGRAGVPLRGAALDIHGDVPRGAGLSSSAAFEVALCLALVALTGAQPLDRLDLARLCSRVENDWVGARTGLLDQITSLFGHRDHALRIDFRSLDIQPVTLELDHFRLSQESLSPPTPNRTRPLPKDIGARPGVPNSSITIVAYRVDVRAPPSTVAAASPVNTFRPGQVKGAFGVCWLLRL